MRLGLGLRGKLAAAAVVALLVVLSMGVVHLHSSRSSEAGFKAVVDEAMAPLITLQEVDGMLKEIRFRIAGVLLDQMPTVGSSNHLKETRSRIASQWAAFKKGNVVHDDEERVLLEKIDQAMAALPEFLDKVQAAYSADDRKALAGLLEDEWPGVHAGLLKPLALLLPKQLEEVQRASEQNARATRRLDILAAAIFVAAAAALLALTFLLGRSITGSIVTLKGVLAQAAAGDLTVRAKTRTADEIGSMADAINQTLGNLGDTVRKVHGAADGLAAASEELAKEADAAAERTGRQTDEVMRISAAMEQLTVSVAEISTGAGNVAAASSEARGHAHSGGQLMASNRQATQRAVAAVGTSSAVISELSDTIGRISDITRVINEIAEQTNLLALNAAIEAARAGEQGRGFAVVADEVRKLAERTSASTGDIRQLVQAIGAKTAAAVKAMNEVADEVASGAQHAEQMNAALENIVETAGRVTRLAEDIAHATREQKQAAEQTSRGMEELSGIVEAAGAGIARFNASAAAASHTAHELRSLVNRFRLD